MIFKVTTSALRKFAVNTQYGFGGHAHKVTTVLQTKNNPQKQKQLRGNEQFQLHMGQYQKQFYYIHIKQRKTLSLYNIFSCLPSVMTNNLAKLVSDPKVTIASDQIFLPRISENSVPVYESLSDFPVTLRTVNKLALGLPVLILTTAVMPYIAFTALALHYFIYFKSSFGKATERLVIKMQLLPETQELIYQKITRTGCIRTSRVRVNDIQAIDADIQATKYKRDLVFERSMRNAIDLNMIYRVKSTGEILMFDREGVWHDEGINHELMP